MINFQEEIKRFRPSAEVDNIETILAHSDLTDMNDLMMEIIKDGIVSRNEAAGSDSDTTVP